MSADPGQIDALLPQTQCRRCGFGGCLPYAEALAAGQADLNRCPPGGAALVDQLSRLLERPAKPIDPDCGAETRLDSVALIDEARCIGCFKCVPACPVDAIIGAKGLLHTVVAAECSGCGLCLPPCPVDCITLVHRPSSLPAPATQAGLWRRRHRARLMREDRASQRRMTERHQRADNLRNQGQNFDIQAALARARSRRIAGPDT